MTPVLTLDVWSFNQVLRRYAELSKRDWADIVNRKALQLAFETLKETPKADAAAIRELESKEWWPKYIAKRITGAGVTFKHKKATIHIQGRGYTRAEARQVSRKIIAARVRSTAFFKSGWLPAIRTLLPLVRDKAKLAVTVGGAKQVGVDKGRARPAVSGTSPAAEIINSAFPSEAKLKQFGVPALQRALERVKIDTAEYILRKTMDSAKKAARR